MTTLRSSTALAVMAAVVVLAGCLPLPPRPGPLDVGIAQPTGGMVSGTVSLAATATGNGPHDVAFYIDNEQVARAAHVGAQWVGSWDSTTIADGTHSLRAQVFDVANNWILSPPVTITTQNAPPPPGTVSVASPSAGAAVSGASVVISGTSSVPVATVGVLMDETPLGQATISGSSWTYTWDTTRAPEGSRLLTAWATDASGNSHVSAPVSVTVNNGVAPAVRVPQVNTAVELGNVGRPPTVLTRDSGVTQQSGNTVTWLFGDTIFNPQNVSGDSFVTATAATASLSAPLATKEPVDANGDPLSALGFTPEEYAYNVAHTSAGGRIALWIIGSAPQADGSVLALYMKMTLPGSDPLTWVGEGAGVARMLPGKTFAWRDPGLTFNKPEPLYADGVVDGSYFDVYQCDNWANPQVGGQCTMGRVPLDQIGTRSAYEFYAGLSAQQEPIWQSDITKAVSIFPTAGPNSGLTITWNSYLGQWVAVYAPVPSSGNIVARTAPAPYGPWSAEMTLFSGRPPSSSSLSARVTARVTASGTSIFGDYAGREHRELQQAGGQAIDVTYFAPGAGFNGDLWMEEVTFSASPLATGQPPPSITPESTTTSTTTSTTNTSTAPPATTAPAATGSIGGR